MKPITLRLCAFGSYGSEQTVDFTVPQQNLFLVTGDTGAGKTTIFDAIVYALYGSVSTSDKTKSGEKLYSQFADKNVTPFVELLFEEDGEIYKVRREPKHYTYKKNGTRNLTMKSETLSLTMPDGRDYQGKEAEIDSKLEELVGLTKEQFMQVAMIAQGEFMEVLKKTSDEKKEIFRKIFKTDIYARIIEETKIRYDEKKNKVNKLLDECRAQVKLSSIPMDYAGYSSMTSHYNSLIEADNFSMAALEEFLEEMDVLCNYLESSSNEANDNYNKANEAFVNLSKELAAANELNKHFDTIEKASSALKECEARKEEINNLRKVIDSVAKAHRIKVESDKLDSAVKALSSEEDALKKNEASLPELNSAYNSALDAMKNAKADKEKADSNYATTNERVDRALKSFAEIDSAKEKCEQLLKLVNAKKKIVDNAKRQIEELNKRENELKEQLKKLKDADVKLNEAETKKKQFDEVKSIRDGLLDSIDEISNKEEELKTVQQNLADWNAKAKSSENELSDARESFYAAQAGILASKLKVNCECPVCGSKSHPNPCKLSAEAVSEEEIKELEAAAEFNNSKREAASNKLSALQTDLEGKKEVYKGDMETLIKKLNELSDLKIKKDAKFDEVESEVVKLEKILDDAYLMASNDVKTYERVTSNLESIASDIEEAVEVKENAEKELAQKSTDLATANGNFQSLNSDLDYKSADEAKNARIISRTAKDKANEFFDASQEAVNAAKTKLDKCEANIKTSRDKIPGLKEDVKLCEKNYKNSLKTEKLSEEEWKTFVDEYDQDTSDYADEVKEYDENVSNNKTLLENSSKAVEGRKKIDTEEMNTRVNEAKTRVDELSKHKDSASSILNTNKNVIDNLKPVMTKHKTAIAQYNTVSKVYEYLAGKVKGGRKMDIETYAQREYLKRILDAANDRFEDMSGGQYELKIVDIDRTSEGRKNNGLDLLVHSNVTNQDREVVTLSGGEKFMAALSLALGMSDEIQAASSAVNLDIMFIDEGFGTLDTKSRNEAIKVLKAMAGGDKLIGIISHVEELKRDVDDLIVVTKTERGSQVGWKSN